MYVSELIKNLEELKNEYGDCKVYMWDLSSMYHKLLSEVYMVKENQFNIRLSSDEHYCKDFDNIKNNIVLL